MKISGATSSTAMAVCSPSSPQRSRNPSTMATNPTPSPAMRSMESDDRNASAQGAHGGRPHAFARLRHLPAPVCLAAEGTKSRQALDELEEPPGERSQTPPLPLRAPRRLPTEEDHAHRHRDDQRHDDREGQPVLGGHPRQQEEGDDDGGRRLGEVARVVGVERAQSPGRGEGELARPLAGQPARPELQAVAEQIAPQARHDPFGRTVRRQVAGGGDHAPDDQGHGGQGDLGRDVAQRHVPQQRAVHGSGQGDGLDHHGRRAQDGDDEGHPGRPAQAGHTTGQLGIDQAGAAAARVGPELRG